MNDMTYLEDFSEIASNVSTSTAPQAADDSDLRTSFDEGYKCGWQDGVAATEGRGIETKEAMYSALQALNFTYFEAREHAMKSVRPVLQAMVDAVLPQLLSESLGGRVVEILGELSDGIEPSVTIACAPENVGGIKELVTDAVKFPVTIEAESTLTVSQAVLHLNEGQTSLDLDGTLAEIRNCIDLFFGNPEVKEEKHA